MNGTANLVRSTPLSVPAHTSHALHGEDAIWQETNCYIDLWIELLHGWGLEPRAALPFTVTQDFEGDHFTFFKYPANDIERLYGTIVQEMAIYDTLEAHLVEQVGRGHTVLVEVDSYYLPDTKATAYRRGHVKTTIGVDTIDPQARRLAYYHSLGYHVAGGDDYDGLLRLTPELAGNADVLFPYAECAKRVRAPVAAAQMADASVRLLREHLARRPAANPVSRLRAVFPGHMERLLARGDAYFHQYTFNVPRQLGANFEMLYHYLTWLGQQGHKVPEAVTEAARTIAGEAKVLQFRLARAAARGRADACSDCLDVLEGAYDRTLAGLVSNFGAASPVHVHAGA